MKGLENFKHQVRRGLAQSNAKAPNEQKLRRDYNNGLSVQFVINRECQF